MDQDIVAQWWSWDFYTPGPGPVIYVYIIYNISVILQVILAPHELGCIRKWIPWSKWMEHVHCQFRLPQGRWCSLAELLACMSRGYTLVQAFDVVWDMTEYGSILNPFRYVWFDIDRYIFEGMSLSRYGPLNLCSPHVVVATLAHLRDFCIIWQFDLATVIQFLHVK